MEKIEILAIIEDALKQDTRASDISMDNDHKSGEVMFTWSEFGESNNFVISDAGIKEQI